MVKKKKCKQCKEPFQPQRPLQYLCSPACAIKRLADSRIKSFKKEVAEEKKLYNEKYKTLSKHEAEARVPYQKWIRWRDRDKPCISCGATTAKQWDGGHFYKAELYSGLIFDERNCHKQCSRCNDLYSGNELAYREGLIKRYGEEYVKELESIKDGLRNYKYTKSQLIEIKQEYLNRLKLTTKN